MSLRLILITAQVLLVGVAPVPGRPGVDCLGLEPRSLRNLDAWMQRQEDMTPTPGDRAGPGMSTGVGSHWASRRSHVGSTR